MKKYRHLLFDFDKTLWDFDNNSKETLLEIFNRAVQSGAILPEFDIFHQEYEMHNLELWELYRRNLVSKQDLMKERFARTLKAFGIEDRETAKFFSEEYLKHLPEKTRLMPGAKEVLGRLKHDFTLHIVTNGFEEVQYRKIANAGLKDFFKEIITSESAGFKKPDPGFFAYTLNRTGASLHECLMIGDDGTVDVDGAYNFGIDAIQLHLPGTPVSKNAIKTVRILSDLINILFDKDLRLMK